MRTKERYEGIIGWFSENMPVAESELNFENTFQLLVAVILSAQCTDKRVNMTTPALFEAFPTPQDLAGATVEQVYSYIRSISYPNNKAKNLVAMARMTANVVGAVVWGKEVMPVDTHVFRVSARIGLTKDAKTPRQTELQLEKNIPSHLLPIAHHWLILHGRYICTARKPKCNECGIAAWCKSYEK